MTLGDFTELLELMHQNFPLTYYPELFLRVLVSCLCGMVIGLERTKRQKAAGIRTHCVIAVASAVMMILSKYGFADLSSEAGALFEASRGADTSRIAAQIVSGVGFLGAGVIFVKGGTIKGLTTAAGMWAMSAIGMAIGAGMYPLGLFTTFVIAMLQIIFHRLHVGDDAFSTHELQVEMQDTPELRKALREVFEEKGMQVLETHITKLEDNYIQFRLSVKMSKHVTFEECVEFVDAHPGVRSLGL